MSIFDNVDFGPKDFVVEDKIQKEERVKDTGVYLFAVKKAYFDRLPSGAISLNIEFITEDNLKMDVTYYITNREGKTYYINKSGEKNFLTGYSMMRSLDFSITGLNRQYPKTQIKQVKIKRNGNEVIEPKEVPIEWINKTVLAMVVKKQVNKKIKDANGNYIEIADWIYVVDVDHYANAVTGKTMKETLNSLEPTFVKNWAEKYDKNYIRDERKIQGGEHYRRETTNPQTYLQITDEIIDEIFN